MKKKIYVSDSHHTEMIATLLQELFGKEVDVHAVEPSERTEERDFDLFFLSAKFILNGVLEPAVLKKKLGAPNAKIVAMSTIQPYLDDVKEKNLGVDFFQDKMVLISHSLEDLPKEAKSTLRSYLD